MDRLVGLDYRVHLAFALLLRFGLIYYGTYHDSVSKVQYTDVDYRVFTDASRYITRGLSPYNRHTYRYTPLVAFLLVPNILLNNCWGKIIFSLIDILNALIIKLIVSSTFKEYLNFSGENENQNQLSLRNRRRSKTKKYTNNKAETSSNLAMLAWLYNPLTLAISTRGNCDSIAVFLVLLTLYLLQCQKCYFSAGLVHGISIHFRLYPIVYSLTFFMYLSKFSFYSDRGRVTTNDGRVVPREADERRTIFKKHYLLYLLPNFDQIRLVQGCVLTLGALTSVFYYLYGYEFLYETYLYHFLRKDTRHNFSLYFYLQYLTAWIRNVGIWQRVLVVLPQVVLLLVLSVRYGLNRFTLNFSILTQTIVLVAYNTVLTSQYFVWIMAILPLCLWQIDMNIKSNLFLVGIWFAAQGAWLLPAYFLEFTGRNTFLFIWIQGISFFCANIAILGRLIMHFMPLKKSS